MIVVGFLSGLAPKQAMSPDIGTGIHEKTRNPSAFPESNEYRQILMARAPEEFRVNTKIRQKLAHRKRRLQRRLDPSDLRGCEQPMFTARNIHYEIGQRTRGLAYGGIGAMHL